MDKPPTTLSFFIKGYLRGRADSDTMTVTKVRAAMESVAAWQRERDAKIADNFADVYEDHKVPGPAHIAACIREWSDETVEKEFAKQECEGDKDE